MGWLACFFLLGHFVQAHPLDPVPRPPPERAKDPGNCPVDMCSEQRTRLYRCLKSALREQFCPGWSTAGALPADFYDSLVEGKGACAAAYREMSLCAVKYSAGENRGEICKPSSWKGPYHFFFNNCHDAANLALAHGASGILLCHVGKYFQHHTVNYFEGLCSAEEAKRAGLGQVHCRKVCLSEPQEAGVTSDPSACCWTQNLGAIDVTSGAGKACAEEKCKGQATGTQRALPRWTPFVVDSFTDCRDAFMDDVRGRRGCLACCEGEANKIVSFEDPVWEHQAQAEEFLQKCRAACGEVPEKKRN